MSGLDSGSVLKVTVTLFPHGIVARRLRGLGPAFGASTDFMGSGSWALGLLPWKGEPALFILPAAHPPGRGMRVAALSVGM